MTNLVGPANNVVDDDFRLCVIVDSNALPLGLLLPDAINVMDEIDEGRWPVRWAERHDGIHTLKGKFLLT